MFPFESKTCCVSVQGKIQYQKLQIIYKENFFSFGFVLNRGAVSRSLHKFYPGCPSCNTSSHYLTRLCWVLWGVRLNVLTKDPTVSTCWLWWWGSNPSDPPISNLELRPPKQSLHVITSHSIYLNELSVYKYLFFFFRSN